MWHTAQMDGEDKSVRSTALYNLKKKSLNLFFCISLPLLKLFLLGPSKGYRW